MGCRRTGGERKHFGPANRKISSPPPTASSSTYSLSALSQGAPCKSRLALGSGGQRAPSKKPLLGSEKFPFLAVRPTAF